MFHIRGKLNTKEILEIGSTSFFETHVVILPAGNLVIFHFKPTDHFCLSVGSVP